MIGTGHDHALRIAELLHEFLQFPTAGADATKVESESSHIRVFQSARGTKDDLVVQSAAAERMGMTDDGDPGGILKIAVQRFEPSHVAVKIDMAKRLAVHEIL